MNMLCYSAAGNGYPQPYAYGTTPGPQLSFSGSSGRGTIQRQRSFQGTPYDYFDCVSKPSSHPPVAPQPSLTRTLSGASSIGSFYNGFYDMPEPQHAPLYSNSGSFYNGFSSPHSAAGYASSQATPAPQPSIDGHHDGVYAAHSAADSLGANGSPVEMSDDATGLARSASSGRALRRQVSFSGVPTGRDETKQRRLAQRPKRMGSRRLNVQAPKAALLPAQQSQVPQEQQQQQQPAPVPLNSHASTASHSGSVFMHGANANPYAPYMSTASPYASGYPRHMILPVSYQPVPFRPYVMNPMAMPQRPAMAGYYY